MSIAVVSPIKLIAESLGVLLESYGYTVSSEVTRDTHLVLVDLIHDPSLVPNPYQLPTVALINCSTKQLEVLSLGYMAGISSDQNSSQLKQAIDSALMVS